MPESDLILSEQVPAGQAEKIQGIVTAIKLEDPALSMTYGTETMQGISRFADDMLQRVRVKDAGVVGENLLTLMDNIQGIDVSALTNGKKGFLESLPLIGSLFNQAAKVKAQYNTMAEQVDGITIKLEQAMEGLLYDVEVLENLFAHNKDFHDQLTMYIEAGKIRLEEARSVELPKLQKEAEEAGDGMTAQKVRDFSEQINRFERRLHDLQLSRTITLQTAPQIRLIQSNDQTLAEKIQTSILSTIPIWKSQLVLALSIQGQQEAARIQKNVADTTNDMLRRNAEILKQSTVETARQVERSVVDIETLREVHGKLIATIEETLVIAQEGREQRAAAEKELIAMEEDMRVKLTSLAAAKTKQVIEGAQGTPALPEQASIEKASS